MGQNFVGQDVAGAKSPGQVVITQRAEGSGAGSRPPFHFMLRTPLRLCNPRSTLPNHRETLIEC